MKKRDAISLFGSTQSALGAALGITKSAISQWPDDLTQPQIDWVTGAVVRLGKIKVSRAATRKRAA